MIHFHTLFICLYLFCQHHYQKSAPTPSSRKSISRTFSLFEFPLKYNCLNYSYSSEEKMLNFFFSAHSEIILFDSVPKVITPKYSTFLKNGTRNYFRVYSRNNINIVMTTREGWRWNQNNKCP